MIFYFWFCYLVFLFLFSNFFFSIQYFPLSCAIFLTSWSTLFCPSIIYFFIQFSFFSFSHVLQFNISFFSLSVLSFWYFWSTFFCLPIQFFLFCMLFDFQCFIYFFTCVASQRFQHPSVLSCWHFDRLTSFFSLSLYLINSFFFFSFTRFSHDCLFLRVFLFSKFLLYICLWYLLFFLIDWLSFLSIYTVLFFFLAWF